MRDFKVQILQDYGLDIDIINGEAQYLDYADQTQDQRAALAVASIKGTLPGALDYGVSWTEQFTESNTVAQLNNEVQLQLQQEAGAVNEDSFTTGNQYTGLMLDNHGSVGVIIMRG